MNIISCLKTCYNICLITGLAPFKLDLRYTYLKNYDILTKLIYILFGCISIITHVINASQNHPTNGLSKLIVVSYWYFADCHIFINAVFFRKSLILLLFKKIMIVDQQIRNCGIIINYKNIKFLSEFYLILNLIGFGFYFVGMSIQGDLKFNIISQNIVLCFACTCYACECCLFVTSLIFVTKVLYKVNTIIIKNNDNQFIKTAISVYDALKDVTKVASDMFGYQLLASFTILFSLLILKLYNIAYSIVYLNRSFTDLSFKGLVWIFTVFLEKFLIFFCCTMCSKQVRNSN